MGEMLTLYCTHCDYSKTYMLGIGMFYTPERVFYGEYHSESGSCIEEPFLKGCVSKSIYNTAKTLLSDGGKPGDYYGHSIYYCKNCKRIEKRFSFSIISKNGEIYVPPYRCGKCRQKLIWIQFLDEFGEAEKEGIDSQKVLYTCPKCGRTCSLESSEVCGIWD